MIRLPPDTARSEHRELCHVAAHLFAVGIADGYFLLAHHHRVATNGVDTALADNERTVYADKLIGRKAFFHALQTTQAHDGTSLALTINLHIVAQRLNIGNVFQFKTDNAAVGPDIDFAGRTRTRNRLLRVGLCGRRLQAEPTGSLADRLEKTEKSKSPVR